MGVRRWAHVWYGQEWEKKSRKVGRNRGGKQECRFLGGLESQMDLKDCLARENLTIPLTVTSFVLWSHQGDRLWCSILERPVSFKSTGTNPPTLNQSYPSQGSGASLSNGSLQDDVGFPQVVILSGGFH